MALRRRAMGGGSTTVQRQTSAATVTTWRSLAHCCSSVITLPWIVDENPHCGLRQSWSSDTYLAASSIRAAELVGGFELGELRGDEAEHDRLVLGDEAQRCEVARSLVVVLEEVRVDVELAEQHLGDRFVPTAREERAAEVAAAEVDADGEIVGAALQRGVDQAPRTSAAARRGRRRGRRHPVACQGRRGTRGWCRRAGCTGNRPRRALRSRRGRRGRGRRRTRRGRDTTGCRCPPGRRGSAPSSATGSRPWSACPRATRSATNS